MGAKKRMPENILSDDEKRPPEEEKKTEQPASTQTKNPPAVADESTGNHPGYTILTNKDIAKAVGIRDLNGVIGNSAALKLRQHLLNPKKYKSEFKKPNPGKMPNNRDAFPVDLKIEEFETHYPPTHIHELTVPTCCQTTTMALLDVASNTDKRLAKIENNISTLFRLFFRLGGRVSINCQYWGGTNPNFEKYKGIRCLCDDRISDGQEIQIDQCLYCTRYEPVMGQCYEIMNDLGANVAAILDDNQASYANMEDYIQLTRAENYRIEKDKGQFDLAMVQLRDPNEKDFSTAWGEGIKMKWDYVPLEDQKTHINWRQSINDDGSTLRRLASFPGNEANSGANIIKRQGIGNVMQANRDAMESYKPVNEYDQDVIPLISRGKGEVGRKDDGVNLYQEERSKPIKEKCAADSLDPLIIACLAICTGTGDYDAIIARYKEVANKIGTQNPAIIISAYNTSVDIFLGTGGDGNPTGGKIPRIDVPMKVKTNEDSGGSGGNKVEDDGVSINWNDKESWLWVDFARRYVQRAKMIDNNLQDLDLFPRVCYLYCAILPECVNSRFDDVNMGFPFTNEQFSQGSGIWYTSPFGMRTFKGETKLHRGIDLGADRGTPIHACHDGIVTAAGGGWGTDCNAVNINHGDGTYSRYLHCNDILVQTGQAVSRGTVIATVGGYGEGDPNFYADHLHLEICHGESEVTSSDEDPLDYFPKLKGCISVGDQLTP